MLTAARVVMDYINSVEDGDVTFTDFTREHSIDWVDWVHMGRPDKITVSVQPGDRLNDNSPPLDPGR